MRLKLKVKRFLKCFKVHARWNYFDDIVGNATYMNPAAESLTGWKLSEAKRMVLQDVFSVNNGLGDEVPIQFSNHKVGNSVQNIFLSNKRAALANTKQFNTATRSRWIIGGDSCSFDILIQLMMIP